MSRLCKRQREEEVVAGDEGISVDKPQRKGKKEQECSRNGEATTSTGLVSYQDCTPSAEIPETCKRKKHAIAAPPSCGIISKTPERCRESYKITRFNNSSTNKDGESLMERDKTDQPTSLPLVVTTGTASQRTSIGVVDIGVNKAAYFFQVSLPGVSKHSGEFSCEIKSDGKVILKGSTTTGCKTIKRHSRVFKMNIQKLCPPGPFKLSFSLPGPVDPRLFSPNFRSDGIFEAIVIRQEKPI